MSKIKSENILAEIVKSNNDFNIRSNAIRRIKDKKITDQKIPDSRFSQKAGRATVLSMWQTTSL